VTTYLIEAYVAIGDMTDLQERARAAAEAMQNEGYVMVSRSLHPCRRDLLSPL
jgi:hypothetical protein